MRIAKYLLGVVFFTTPFLYSQKLTQIKEITTYPLTAEDSKTIDDLVAKLNKQDKDINEFRDYIAETYLRRNTPYVNGSIGGVDKSYKENWSDTWYFSKDFTVVINSYVSNRCGDKGTVVAKALSNKDVIKAEELYLERETLADRILSIETATVDKSNANSPWVGTVSYGPVSINLGRYIPSFDLTLSSDHKFVFYSETSSHLYSDINSAYCTSW